MNAPVKLESGIASHLEAATDAASDPPDAATDAAIGEARRWYWQRISAMVLAICVLIHLVVIIYAVRGGLSAEEILGRTRGNPLYAAFYGVFVLACAVHVPAGIANIAEEWAGLDRRSALWVARGFALVLLLAGLRAVVAVVA